MKRLLEEYKETRKQTKRIKEHLLSQEEKYKENTIAIKQIKEEIDTVNSYLSNINYAISYMEKGYAPSGLYRGIEKNDAYYLVRPYEPKIMETFIESEQVFGVEMIEEGYSSLEEKMEIDRIRFEESISPHEYEVMRRVINVLTNKERDLLLLHYQGKPLREIAEMLTMSKSTVHRTLKKVKAVIKDIVEGDK